MIYKYNNSYYLAIDGSLIRLEQTVLSKDDVKDCPCDKDENIYNALLRFVNKDDSSYINLEEIENALKVLGFTHIARDADNALFAYSSEPEWDEDGDSFLVGNIKDNILELNENWFINIKKGETKEICKLN